MRVGAGGRWRFTVMSIKEKQYMEKGSGHSCGGRPYLQLTADCLSCWIPGVHDRGHALDFFPMFLRRSLEDERQAWLALRAYCPEPVWSGGKNMWLCLYCTPHIRGSENTTKHKQTETDLFYDPLFVPNTCLVSQADALFHPKRPVFWRAGAEPGDCCCLSLISWNFHYLLFLLFLLFMLKKCWLPPHVSDCVVCTDTFVYA